MKKKIISINKEILLWFLNKQSGSKMTELASNVLYNNTETKSVE